eukprot:COSAG06_NODE_1424_length_9498_cov_12.066816_7_plen_784_part_00
MVVRPVCEECHGEDSLYCETPSRPVGERCQRYNSTGNEGWNCAFGADGAAQRSHSGGTVCVASPWPCSVCSSPAVDSEGLACELSGGGGTQWGLYPPHGPSYQSDYDLAGMSTRVVGWNDTKSNVKCLSSVPAACLHPMTSGETNSVPSVCLYRSARDCGSDPQALATASVVDSCGPSGPTSTWRPGLDPSCDASEWSWAARVCSVDGTHQERRIRLRGEGLRSNPTTEMSQPMESTRTLSEVPGRCGGRTVSTLALGRCVYCDTKDVVFQLPVAKAGAHFTLPCPQGTHTGNISVSCNQTGWLISDGLCTRKSCPVAWSDFSVQVYKFLSDEDGPWSELSADYREWSQPDRPWFAATQSRVHIGQQDSIANHFTFQSLGATTTFARAVEGTNTTLPCPRNARHSFIGTVSRDCPAHSTQWNEQRAQCTILQCPAGNHSFEFEGGSLKDKAGRQKFAVLMPAASLGATVELDCCSSFTKAGGCADEHFLIGRIRVVCGMDGRWPDRPTAGRCVPSSSVKFRMDGPAHKHATAYRDFRRRVLDVYGNSAQWTWSVPQSGALFSISVQNSSSSEWLPVASTKSGVSPPLPSVAGAYRPTLDSLGGGSAGRGAAAIASVGCRQLGFAQAVFALNCGALLLLEVQNDRSSTFWNEDLRSSTNVTCDRWVTEPKTGAWGCAKWAGEPSSLLRSLCGGGGEEGQDVPMDWARRVPWGGMGTDAQTDSRWQFAPGHYPEAPDTSCPENPDEYGNGASDNPSTYAKHGSVFCTLYTKYDHVTKARDKRTQE